MPVHVEQVEDIPVFNVLRSAPLRGLEDNALSIGKDVIAVEDRDGSSNEDLNVVVDTYRIYTPNQLTLTKHTMLQTGTCANWCLRYISAYISNITVETLNCSNHLKAGEAAGLSCSDYESRNYCSSGAIVRSDGTTSGESRTLQIRPLVSARCRRVVLAVEVAKTRVKSHLTRSRIMLHMNFSTGT